MGVSPEPVSSLGPGAADYTCVVADTPPVRLPTVEHLTLLEREMAAALTRQREAWDGLDRKGTTIMATTGVLLGLVVNNAETFQAYRDPAPTAFGVALAMLVLGIDAGLATLWPRAFTVVPVNRPGNPGEPGVPLVRWSRDTGNQATVSV